MNERLVFYCDRSATAGSLYTWAEGEGAAHALVQVWCRMPLADIVGTTTTGGLAPDPTHIGQTGDVPPARQMAGPAVDQGRQGERPTLHSQIAAAGGGLIARTGAAGPPTSLRVETVPADGFVAADALLLLAPGMPPRWVPWTEAAIDLEPGAFVLLPATRADQSDLAIWLVHLERLPGDYRDLLLNCLRRPGLEAVIGRLGGRLDRLDEGLGRLGTSTALVPPPAARGGRPWPWLPTVLLLLNLAGVIGLWLRAPRDDAAESLLISQAAAPAPTRWEVQLPASGQADPLPWNWPPARPCVPLGPVR
jgi:hypothetical protein